MTEESKSIGGQYSSILLNKLILIAEWLYYNHQSETETNDIISYHAEFFKWNLAVAISVGVDDGLINNLL